MKGNSRLRKGISINTCVKKYKQNTKVDLSVARRNLDTSPCKMNFFSEEAAILILFIFWNWNLRNYFIRYLLLLGSERKKRWLVKSGPLHSCQFYIGLVCFGFCWGARGGAPPWAPCPAPWRLKPDQLDFGQQWGGTGLQMDGFLMFHTIDQLLSLRFDPSQACTLNCSGFAKSHWEKTVMRWSNVTVTATVSWI